MWWEGHFTSVIFVEETENPYLNIKRLSEKHKLRDILQINWLNWFESQDHEKHGKTKKILTDLRRLGKQN